MERHAARTHRFRPGSLRQRLLIAGALVALACVTAAALAHYHATAGTAARGAGIAGRGAFVEQLAGVRDAVWQLQRSLEPLWRASSRLPINQTREAVAEASERMRALRERPAQHAPPATIARLEQAAAELARVRELLTVAEPGSTGTRLIDAVQPLLDRVRRELATIEGELHRATLADAELLAQAAPRLSWLLWGLVALLLMLLGTGFWAFDRTLLRPLATMARALRAEAGGEPDIVLPEVRCAETAALVEAFALMRRQVQDRQRALESQALYDPLTGLPNRVLLRDRLDQAVAAAQRTGRTVALMFLDMDRFKEVNDTLGHAAGDRLLQEFSTRLRHLVRAADTVARLGGDEFAILLPEIGTEEARQVAGRIGESLERPVTIDDHALYMGCSVGIALYPEHAEEPPELIRCADVAMYAAKRERSLFAIYDPLADTASLSRLEMGHQLREALEGNCLELHFQPQLDLARNEVTGVEALLRWHHPERGPIPPDEFIPVAEQTGLIRPLTRWVLVRAVSRFAAWQREGLPLRTVAVNLSCHNLQDPDLGRQVKEVLERWDIAPESLVLEITESAMMADPVHAVAVLRELDAIGVQLAVDDFGTGYSSLAYLKRLPVKKLKIDKSFVREIPGSENDTVIVRSTIELAHNLGLKVVAEGAESATVVNYLTLFGCDLVQGYHVCKPLPGDALGAWLRERAEERRSGAWRRPRLSAVTGGA